MGVVLICTAIQQQELPNYQKLIGMFISLVSCASVGLLAPSDSAALISPHSSPRCTYFRPSDPPSEWEFRLSDEMTDESAEVKVHHYNVAADVTDRTDDG